MHYTFSSPAKLKGPNKYAKYTLFDNLFHLDSLIKILVNPGLNVFI